MLDSKEEALSLLRRLKYSTRAELFFKESKKVLTEYDSEVKREFHESLVTSNLIHDVKKIPRTTKQEIERLCQNKGEIQATKKLIEMVFRFDKNVLYDFLELVINNCQVFLFKNLLLAVQQKNNLFYDILPLNQSSMSQPISTLYANSQSMEVDKILVQQTKSITDIQPKYLSEKRSFDHAINPAYSTNTRSTYVQLSNAQHIDGQLQTTSESNSQKFLSNTLPADVDIRELHELRSLRNKVIEMYGSIEEFDREFMNIRNQNRSHQQDMESELTPDAFSFTDGAIHN